LETVEKGDTLIDGFEGEIVLFAVSLISSLSFVSFTSSLGHGGFSISNELLINGDEVLKSSSLGVEGVLEMGRSNTESDLGVSESGVDFQVDFVMLSGSPSVLFVLRTELEVKISDEVLEGGDQFIHWALSLDLKFEETSSDSAPTSLFEGLNFVLKSKLEG